MTSRCMAKKTLLDTQNTSKEAKPYKTHTSKLFSARHLNLHVANELRKQTLFDINLDIYSGEIVMA